jgi:hypothetical protein
MSTIHDKAHELGYTLKKGPTKFSGYVLKRQDVKATKRIETKRAKKESLDELDDVIADDESQEEESQQDVYPLGDDFRASLSDIEDFLENLASDIAAGRVKASDDDDPEPEVETIKLAKIKPPSKRKLATALRGHEHAAEIKTMAKSAKVSAPNSAMHDLQFEQRALKSRLEFNPNWNQVRGHQINEYDETDRGRDLREYLAEVERENRNLIPPDPTWTPESAMPMPADMADVAVVRVKRRVSKKS